MHEQSGYGGKQSAHGLASAQRQDELNVPAPSLPLFATSPALLKPAPGVPMNKARLNSNGGGNLPDCV
jgi:hypothetical protein